MGAQTVPWSGANTYRGAAAAIGAVILLMALVPVLRNLGLQEAPFAQLALVGALEGVLLVIVWVLAVRPHGATLARLGFRRSSLFTLTALPLLFLAASIGAATLYTLIVELAGVSWLRPPAFPEALRGLSGARGIVTAALVVGWAPLAEETFFRGFLFQGLVSSFGPTRAAAASALLFATSHGSVALLAPTFASGLLLTWLFTRTRSLWPGVVAHALQNGIVLSVAR